VQHVFPTTNELVTAMIDHVNDRYEAAYRQMAERLPFSTVSLPGPSSWG
jgi:hypothetical protein